MRRAFICILSVLPIAGCATQDHDQFSDVQKTVQDRTGRQIQWDRQTTNRTAVETAVRQRLAKPLTVNAAVQIALLNNQHLQADFEELGIAQSDLVQAGLLKNPILDLSVRIPASAPPRTYLDIAATEDFLDIALIPARKALASDQLEQAKARITQKVLSMAVDVSQAFYADQAAEQELELNQTIAGASAASLVAAQKLRQAGNISDLDYATIQQQDGQVQLDLDEAENQATGAYEHLSDLMGLSDEELQWSIGSPLPEVPTDDIPAGNLETLAIQQRLDLVAARRQVIIDARKLRLASDFRLFQNVDLGPQAEHETDGQWRIGPTLSLPVPLFDQGQATVSRAFSEYFQSLRELDAMEIDAKSQVRQARSALLHAGQRARLYHDSILPARRIMLQQLQLQYNGMLVGVFRLLDARRDEADAARHYVESLKDYWTARAELERAIGGPIPESTSSSTPGVQP